MFANPQSAPRSVQTDRVWEIIAHVGIAMLTTRFSGGLRARPLEARPDRAAGLIRFLTDKRSGKEDEILAAPEVGLVFVDTDAQAYLSITGQSELVQNREEAAAIWKATDTVWWPGGPDDQNVLVLRVAPVVAELWDGPSSRTVAAFEFVKARLTGAEPNLGENRKISLRMK
jgi:general stress protein 26